MELWSMNYTLECVPPSGKGTGFYMPTPVTGHGWGWEGSKSAGHLSGVSCEQ